MFRIDQLEKSFKKPSKTKKTLQNYLKLDQRYINDSQFKQKIYISALYAQNQLLQTC